MTIDELYTKLMKLSKDPVADNRKVLFDDGVSIRYVEIKGIRYDQDNDVIILS
jgi:hypothetical protein